MRVCCLSPTGNWCRGDRSPTNRRLRSLRALRRLIVGFCTCRISDAVVNVGPPVVRRPDSFRMAIRVFGRRGTGAPTFWVDVLSPILDDHAGMLPVSDRQLLLRGRVPHEPPTTATSCPPAANRGVLHMSHLRCGRKCRAASSTAAGFVSDGHTGVRAPWYWRPYLPG